MLCRYSIDAGIVARGLIELSCSGAAAIVGPDRALLRGTQGGQHGPCRDPNDLKVASLFSANNL
jgi:hypothetical protein